MIPSRKSLLLAGLLATSALASSGAFAQAPAAPSAPPAAEAKADPQAHRADRAKRIEQMQQRRAERLSALKEKLKLTPAQEGAWNSFATAQQRPAGQPRFDREEFAKLTTPQRLDRMQAMQAERAVLFAKRADATRGLYAALSPEQQKTFDTESMARFGRGERGEHHRHAAPPPAKG
jgi:hypothetical protein